MALDKIYKKPATERSRVTAGMLCYLMLGLIIWALHFGALYGVHSIACAHYATQQEAIVGPMYLWICAVTLIAVALMIGAMLRPRLARRLIRAGEWPRAQQKTYDQIMIGLALLSCFGVIAAGSSAILVPACGVWR